ncbi:MAG TPA: carotenoid biosynthesis protein [Pyrinomonadaceae bacterium]
MSATTTTTGANVKSRTLYVLRRAALWSSLAVFAVLWVGGVASAWLGVEREDAGTFASLFLLTAGLVVLLGERTKQGALSLACVALLGFAVEAVGVRFGVPFGRYVYTDSLWPRMFGVPFVLGPAWMVLVAFARDAAGRLRLEGWRAVLFAALLTTATDLVIDPLAANRLGYWKWVDGGSYYGVPVVNFVGWFLTALVACRLAGARPRANFWAGLVGSAILLFFTLLALAHSLPYVALTGFALCLAPLMLATRAHTSRLQQR